MTLLRAPRSIGATIAALTLLLTGCREEPVRTYRTGKEPTPAAVEASDPHAGHDHAAIPPAGELPPGHPPIGGEPASTPASGDAAALPAGHPPIGSGPLSMPTATGPATDSITWAAPDHWAAKPLGAMRRGSFTARNEHGTADCSIIVLAAAQNPLLENINRWRGQIGLAPITDAQLPAVSATLDSAGLTFTTVDLVGPAPAGGAATRILGAILYRGEEAWFFKLTGPDAAVAAEQPAFLDFLRTVRPATP